MSSRWETAGNWIVTALVFAAAWNITDGRWTVVVILLAVTAILLAAMALVRRLSK